MSDDRVTISRDGGVATVSLNDPDRRNALGETMFDALEAALESLGTEEETTVVLLRGEGRVFCAGFNLAAVVEDPALMGKYIERLSRINRRLRRLDQVVVVAVQGAAIAGGCALVSACDLVVMSRGAKVGYPVHRLGVTPAITIPTLQQAIGSGAARALLMGGELINGEEAHRIGLATHLTESDDTVGEVAMTLCLRLGVKPAGALRITKRWLNDLDGSLDDARFDRTVAGSLDLTRGEEAITLLREFWATRTSG